MESVKNIPLKHVLSSLLMLFALVWLSISTPFVYANQQAQQKISKKLQADKKEKAAADDTSQTSTPEEDEVVTSVTNISEYLHSHNFAIKHFIPIAVVHNKCHPSDLYFAYHPDLISPPPEA